MLQYNVPDFRNSLGFLTCLAKKRGFLQKGGAPNAEKAATAFLRDWTGWGSSTSSIYLTWRLFCQHGNEDNNVALEFIVKTSYPTLIQMLRRLACIHWSAALAHCCKRGLSIIIHVPYKRLSLSLSNNLLRAKLSYYCEAPENPSLPTYLCDATVAQMQKGWNLDKLSTANQETLNSKSV